MGGARSRDFCFVVLLGISMAATAFGAHDVIDLFAEHFENKYQASKCGQNIETFARAIKNAHGDANGFYVVSIVNKGFTVFGLVNVEKARGERFHKPVEEERNWYRHVVLMDDAGNVYDFDYGIEPQVVSLEDYVENMFLDEEECGTGATADKFCVGRDKKLKDYELESQNAESVLSKDRTKKTKKVRMGAALKNWKVLLE